MKNNEQINKTEFMRKINFVLLGIGAITLLSSLFIGVIPFVIGAILIVIGFVWGTYRLISSEFDIGWVCFIFGIVLVALLVVAGGGAIKQVDAGEVAIVINSPNEDMRGAVYDNGWYFNPLFITSNVEIIRYNTQVAEYVGYDVSDDNIGSITVISSDIQTIFMDVAVIYNIDRDDVSSLRYTFGSDWRNIIDNTVRGDKLRSVCVQYSAEDLLKRTRADASGQVNLETEMFEAIVDEFAKQKFPVNVVGVYVREIRVPTELAKAIEQKIVAEQLKLKAGIDAERILIEANAQAAKQVALSQGEADAMMVLAQAKADAVNMILMEFKDSGGDPDLQAFLAWEYINVLRDPNSNVTFVVVPSEGGYLIQVAP